MNALKPCPFCGSEAGIPTNLDQLNDKESRATDERS